MLQNRVTAGTNMLNSVLGLATGGGGHYGNLSGGLLSPLPADFGQNLVQGITGWATELGGGPDVYTSAANLVKAADPTNQSGLAAQGYAFLTQALQKYRDLTGQPHPAEALVNQPRGDTGFTSPLTNTTPNAAATAANQINQFGFNPQASTAALNAAGYQDTPAGRAAAVAAGQGNLLNAPQVVRPTLPAGPGAAVPLVNTSPYLSSPNQVPGQNYGAATAYPFVAPMTIIPTAPTVTVAA
jgi:hypothetical protein